MVKSQTIQLPLMFEILMSKITLKTSANYRDEILQSLISCIDADVRCLSTWTSSHQKHLYQSDLLLKQIGELHYFQKFLKSLPFNLSIRLIFFDRFNPKNDFFKFFFVILNKLEKKTNPVIVSNFSS